MALIQSAIPVAKAVSSHCLEIPQIFHVITVIINVSSAYVSVSNFQRVRRKSSPKAAQMLEIDLE